MIDVNQIDYRPLTSPVDKAAVKDFKRQAKSGTLGWSTGSSSAAQIVSFVVLGIVGIVFVVVFSTMFRMFSQMGHTSTSVMVPMVVIFVIAAIVMIVRTFGQGNWERWYRLSWFAQVNGMTAIPRSPGPGYPGLIFSVGDTRLATDRIQTTDGRFIDIGNYQYTTGSGKERQTHNWGYLAFKLDRQLPNIVLDSKSNNGLFGASNLPASIDKKQVLSLEGNFDQFFTLYCPREYERDALYVFTPDLMALLIDNAGAFDVEIVDDWMFVYSSTKLESLNPATWQRLLNIVATVGAKTLDQTERYRDERMVPMGTPALQSFAASGNAVAPEGRRLRKKSNWVAFATIAVFIIASFIFQTLMMR